MFGFGKSKNDPPADGEGTGNFASASEQDRYGSHFSGLGDKAADKIKEGANKALHYKGEGAEQDRYGAHFARLGLDEQQVHRAAQAIKNSGKQPGWFSGNFGLGYDGQVRALRMANAQGVGAEQERFGSHFSGIDAKDVRNKAHNVKETVKEATIGGR